MSAQNKQLNPFCINVSLGSVSADKTFAAFRAPRKACIEQVQLVNGAVIAASDTNYVVLNVNAGASLLAQLDTRAAAEGAIALNEAKLFGLDGAAPTPGWREPAVVIAKGTDVQVQYDELDAGSNVALTDATVNIIGYWL